jgi:zinc protease
MKQIQLFIVGLFLSIVSYAQLKLMDNIPLDPKIKTGKLSNGLTYYIRPNQKPEKKVELRLVVNAGSILEDNDQQGLAHFTEHMAFNGTTHFKKNELVSFLQSIGVEFGADLNAYTGFDETVYILPIPLSEPSNLNKGLQVLQDWAGGLSFESKQIDDERAVLLEESRSGKGAEDRMFRKIYPREYAGSRYAERLPIGKDSILKTFKYDAIKRFYKDWYRPNLMAVIAVGDIDVNQTEKLIQQYFGGLKNPTNPRPRPAYAVPARTKTEAMVVTDAEATNFSIQLNYSTVKKAPIASIADYRNNEIIQSIFVAMLNQRLNELSQSGNPPFTYAVSYLGSYARNHEAFSSYIMATQKGTDSAIQAVITEIARVKQFGFTQDELDRVKKQQLASYEKAYNNKDKTESAQFIEEYIKHFLEQKPSPGIETAYNYNKELLPGIKLEEVNALINELKKNEKIFIAVQGPEKSEMKISDSNSILAILDKVEKSAIKAYTEKAIANSLLKNIPNPGTLVKETKNDVLDYTELVYANGAKVIIKNTNFKQDEIILNGVRKGGFNIYPSEDKQSANYASQAIQQMGVGDFSPVDLKKFLSGKIASASVGLGPNSVKISGNSSIKDAETMFQLLYLNLTAPRKDEALFNGWKDKQKAQYQFMMADPTFSFVDSVYKTLYAKNPLAPIVLPTPGDFEKINLNKSMQVYKELTGDANDFTFILVGNVEVEKIKPLLATYIGSLPSNGKKAAFFDDGVRMAKGNLAIKFNKGSEPKSFILNVYSGEVNYSEDLELKTDLLNEILNIKIIEELREKIGGIYGGGINGSVSKYPYNFYSMGLQLPCGPENVDKLIAAADAEIEKVKTNGPAQTDLDKVKKTLQEKYTTNVKENRYWSSILQSLLINDLDQNRPLNYIQLINAITTDQIKQTANLLFDGKNVLKAVLYPEKK